MAMFQLTAAHSLFVTFENSGLEYSGVVEPPKNALVVDCSAFQNLLPRLAREEVVVVVSSSVSNAPLRCSVFSLVQ